MDSKQVLKICVGGCVFAVLRGLFELYRLVDQYPVATDLLNLTIQILVAYTLLIGVAGAFIVWIIFIFFQKKAALIPYLPLVWLLLLTGFDFMGSLSDVPKSCLTATGMPPRFQLSPDAPDIVFVTVDTCRADSLGCYGNPDVKSPVLDKLAKKGFAIQDAVTSIPVTTPGHATIMTGQDPPQHGSRFNAVPVNSSSRALAEVFRDNGYKTGAFISAFPVTAEVSHLNRGFDCYDQLLTPDKLHPLLYRSTALSFFTRFGPFRAAERKWFRVIPSAMKWWDSIQNSKHFTWLHFYDPHFPYQPEPVFQAMYLDNPALFSQDVFEVVSLNQTGMKPDPKQVEEYKKLYLSEISAVDKALEKVISYQMQTTDFENCTIIVTADHGESLDEHGYYFSHGEQLYDPSLKVPFIVCSSSADYSHHVVKGQLPLRKTADFICKLAGVNTGEAEFDRSHLIVTDQGNPGEIPSDYCYCESGAGVYTAAHVPDKSRIAKKKRGVRTFERKVITGLPDGSAGYDLRSDPGEDNPLSIHQPEYQALEILLGNYVTSVESDSGNSIDMPDSDAIRELRMLGYVE